MSLLCLPPNIRFAIYVHAGVEGVNTAGPSDINKHGRPEFEPCFCSSPNHGARSGVFIVNLNHRPSARQHALRRDAVTHSLLLTCSTIYNELARSIYSNRQFVIRARDDERMVALRRLRPSSVRALRRLSIDLNSTSCWYGWVCDDENDEAWLRLSNSDPNGDPHEDREENGENAFNPDEREPFTITNDLHMVRTIHSHLSSHT